MEFPSNIVSGNIEKTMSAYSILPPNKIQIFEHISQWD